MPSAHDAQKIEANWGILQSHLAKTDLRLRLEFGTAYLTKEYPPVG
jgi:hypothetical protein